MTTFRFRLQAVLKLREADRDQRRAELAEAYEAERILQEKARELADELAQVHQRTKQASSPGAVDVDQLLDARRYQLLLQAQARQLQTQFAQVNQELERRRLVLVEADRQVRVLENLRQRQQQQWQEGAAKREQWEMDEIAGRQTHRRLRERTVAPADEMDGP